MERSENPEAQGRPTAAGSTARSYAVLANRLGENGDVSEILRKLHAGEDLVVQGAPGVTSIWQIIYRLT